MTNLTGKWKNGELKEGFYYIELIPEFQDQLAVGFCTGYYFELFADSDIKQVLAPVPSYEEWQSLNELVDCMSDTGKAFAHMLSPFTDDYFNGLTTKDIAELAKKSIRLTTQHCEDTAEIDKLKELLSKCVDELSEFNNSYYPETQELLTKIDEVLK